MRRRLIDGIVWVAVGVTLVVHAGIIAVLGWLDRDAAGGPIHGETTMGAIVAVGFVCVGVAALYLGVRRITSVPPS